MGQFTIYKSTDASAPTLSGTAGDLTTLLDAVLVNGYGAKAAAGWTISFTAANKRVYKQGGGCGFEVRVRDNAGGTGGAKEALIRGGESWADIDTTLTGFPSTVQSVLTDNGMVVRKSASADATVRAWKIFADDKTFYLFVLTGDAAGTYRSAHFGDFDSYVTADPYACEISGRNGENDGATTYEKAWAIALDVSTAQKGYVARNYAGTGGSLEVSRVGDGSKSGGVATMYGNIAFLNGPDGGLYLSPLWIGEPVNKYVRGVYRGIWYPLHAVTNFTDGDTFSGVGDLAGKTFEVVKMIFSSGADGIVIIETSNTLS